MRDYDGRVIHVLGANYVAAAVDEDSTCSGCAAFDNGTLCHALPDCDRPVVIFKEVA